MPKCKNQELNKVTLLHIFILMENVLRIIFSWNVILFSIIDMWFDFVNYLEIIFQTDEDILLRKRIKTHTKSAVRDSVSVGRLADMYYDLKQGSDNQGSRPSVFLGIDNGYYTIFTGTGPMLDDFIQNGKLCRYTGHNVQPKFPGDPNYRKSKLRFAPFDKCFNFVNSDVDERKSQFLCLFENNIRIIVNVLFLKFQRNSSSGYMY